MPPEAPLFLEVALAVRSMTRLVIVAAACILSLADPAWARDKDEPRLTLPTEWKAGSRQRYRVSWERKVGKWNAPGAPPRAFDTRHAGEITVTVLERTRARMVVRWEPTVAVDAVPPATSDLDAGGVWMWHRQLALPLELGFDPRATDTRLTLLNEAAVGDEVAGDMRDVMRIAIGREAFARMEAECQEDPTGPGCGSLKPAAMAWKLSTAALFDCAGLDVNLRRPEAWQAPHTDKRIGADVSIEYRQEVVGFDPGAPVLRIKAAREPNAAQMRALIAREMAKVDASPAVMEAIGGWNVRFESDCTVDRRSGWPVTAELRATGSAEAFEGVEIVRLERVDPPNTARSNPKR